LVRRLVNVSLRAHPMNDSRLTMPRKEGIAMPNSDAVASTQAVEAASPTDCFKRRFAICLVQTVFDVIIVARYARMIYLATSHESLQQLGVTLLFAVLLGSLARMWFLALKSQAR
jgi:hypothetical protein